MGFRVVVFTDSNFFYAALERAFESQAIALERAPLELLVDGLALQDFLGSRGASVVVNAPYLNFQPTECLAFSCTALNIPLLHLSSYRVFDANQNALDEAVMPMPTDAQGQWLLALEQPVLAMAHAMVLRLPWLLHGDSESLLARVCEGLLCGEPLQVSEDVCGYIITADEVSRFLVAMTQQIILGANNWGVFHLRSSDSCSEAEFTDAVARLLKSEGWPHVQFVTFKGASLMLTSSLLLGRRSTDCFGIQLRSFRLGLKGYLQHYLAGRM